MRNRFPQNVGAPTTHTIGQRTLVHLPVRTKLQHTAILTLQSIPGAACCNSAFAAWCGITAYSGGDNPRRNFGRRRFLCRDPSRRFRTINDGILTVGVA